MGVRVSVGVGVRIPFGFFRAIVYEGWHPPLVLVLVATARVRRTTTAKSILEVLGKLLLEVLQVAGLLLLSCLLGAQ